MGTSDHRPSGHCLCLYPSTFSLVILLDHIMYQNTIIFLEISFHMFLLYVRYGTVLIFFFKTVLSMDFISGIEKRLAQSVCSPKRV